MLFLQLFVTDCFCHDARCQFHQYFTLAFLHRSVLPSFSIVTVWLSHFLCKNIGAKSANKMLIKLTTGRQPFNYHLCTNRVKISDLTYPLIKTNWQSLFILIASLLIHIFIQIKIKIYKYKKRHTVHIISQTEFVKNLGILDIDKNSMASLATNVINLSLISTAFIFSTYVNHMDPDKANKYPLYLLFYFYNLLFLCILFGSISLTYYLRHPPLRKAIYREMTN